MSGHNKWSKVKNVKGKEDAKRASAFTKLSRKIMVAAREGGANPDYNSSLAIAIEQAKAENMPNDNIQRAIKKGTGELNSGNFEAMTYEGYGPEGLAVIVECLTDNKNRTAGDVRHIFDVYGGSLGTTGSVTFQFDRKGILAIDKAGHDEEELMMEALDAGAEDLQSLPDSYLIITDPADFQAVNKQLTEQGFTFQAAQVGYLPKNTVSIQDADKADQAEKMIDALEENDDVQEVYTNWAESEEEA